VLLVLERHAAVQADIIFHRSKAPCWIAVISYKFVTAPMQYMSCLTAVQRSCGPAVLRSCAL
jgi:hypothetical protein